ncbi:AAA family ATPase [Sphingomonas sp. ZT3P38]|uniref:AAA family ATPase n=1 Tax=Parasphingomonas zepuensis TaxID=3096161 RepID=UPI002FC7919F
MPTRLKHLSVEDFRSIRGPIGVSLDAPVVLIHGPNGTGKTTLLSAIELALTGAVPSLERLDQDYLAHLPHKLASKHRASIVLKADGLGENGEGAFTADGASIIGEALLDTDSTRFYTERCYLAQATLGRLLEIYEHQDNRKSDSPLTRFVKELLGLDALDALIEGLHAAGDVRRLREVAPLFWAARSDSPELEAKLRDAEFAEVDIQMKLTAAETHVRELAAPLASDDAHIDTVTLHRSMVTLMEGSERRLIELARLRRDILGASDQVQEASLADGSGERARAEEANLAAREALAAWQSGSGEQLEELITAVQASFPDVPPLAADPAASQTAALTAVRAAGFRAETISKSDIADAGLLAEVQVEIRQGEGRVEQIDRELADAKGANRELAEALTAISSHIKDERCPVCARDYSELSATPLAEHISAEVARLVTAAGRVEALVRDRSATAAAVAAAQRREADLLAKRLPAQRRDAIKLEIAKLTEWVNSLEALGEAARTGTRVIRAATYSAQVLSAMNSTQSSVSGLRGELANHARTLALHPPAEDIPLRAIVDDLVAEIAGQEAAMAAHKEKCEEAIQTLANLSDLRMQLEKAESTCSRLFKQHQNSAGLLVEADRRIGVARDLVAKAQGVRSAEVRRVFNDDLNAVWRELFIRLAPDEDFVPAFALPEVAGQPVEAVLETRYRAGGKGGNPRGMLSSGNLNTAALTLFLALHLSVPETLPWLIIDDPVQSMDDVHIAQFAALLRTLKQHGRQVIIAVHDRPLFDYLALELSPAFNGDRLVTIELGRDADGKTTAPWNLIAFEPDRAIAA